MSLVDVSGQDGHQQSHCYFSEYSDAMIFTLDVTRRDHVDWNEQERMLIERLLDFIEDVDSALLLFVNKMDRPDAGAVCEVMISLRLDQALERYEKISVVVLKYKNEQLKLGPLQKVRLETRL